jgi:hypothetical protein
MKKGSNKVFVVAAADFPWLKKTAKSFAHARNVVVGKFRKDPKPKDSAQGAV